jgi:hypothetical protein
LGYDIDVFTVIYVYLKAKKNEMCIFKPKIHKKHTCAKVPWSSLEFPGMWPNQRRAIHQKLTEIT